TIDGVKESLTATLEKDFIASYYPSEEKDVRISIAWEELSLPITKGQKVGEVIVFNECGFEIKKEAIFAANAIKKPLSKVLIVGAILLFLSFALIYYLRAKASYASGRGK